jgi:hypothetical protein
MGNLKADRTSDSNYVINLCDEVLGREGLRQHRFDFLLGDPSPSTGRQVRLPVGVFYPDLKLVIEYNGRHGPGAHPLLERRQPDTTDDRRVLYGRRRREILPRHGINFMEICYTDLPHDSRRHLLRTENDLRIIHQFLAGYVFTSGMRSHTHHLLRRQRRRLA